jgi:hypothetical protein
MGAIHAGVCFLVLLWVMFCVHVFGVVRGRAVMRMKRRFVETFMQVDFLFPARAVSIPSCLLKLSCVDTIVSIEIELCRYYLMSMDFELSQIHYAFRSMYNVCQFRRKKGDIRSVMYCKDARVSIFDTCASALNQTRMTHPSRTPAISVCIYAVHTETQDTAC